MDPARRLARRLSRKTEPSRPAPAQEEAVRAPAGEASSEEEDGLPMREMLLRWIGIGHSVDQALVWQVRALLADDETDEAWSIALSLRAHAETETIGRVLAGIVAYRRGFEPLAREALREVAPEVWTKLVARAWVRSGLAVEPDETLQTIRELVAADPAYVPVRSWLDILTAVFGHGDHELAAAIFEVFDRRLEAEPESWPEGTRYRAWMRPWIEAGGEVRTAPATGRRSFAIMDYGHPGADQASANLGDHIQTLASLGHLVRHQGVRLHGPEALTALLRELGARSRPELRLDDVEADVDVLTVHRDASTYEAIPEDTWVLCFGWYMQPLFRMRVAFPLHPNLRPIFTSFHCNTREMLTPEGIEYLRRYGPVGCRDWNTVDLLLSLDVPAFFSGCLTMTTAGVFPELASPPPSDAPVAYVDVPAPEGAPTYTHQSDEVRSRPFVANIRAAIELLETYRTRHARVVTSRLHCYLPVRSLGVDVDFQPSNRSDIRFDGLIDLDDARFRGLGERMTSTLEQVMRAVLSGRPEAEVYALWRDLTAADVAAAAQRRERGLELPPVTTPIAEQREQIAEATRTVTGTGTGEPVHVAVVVNKHLARHLPVLAASLLEHASRPVHLWALTLPGPDDSVENELGDRFPELTYSTVPLRGLGGDLARPREVVRLLLADLLPSVDRLVVLPVPSVVEADIAELADLDLGAGILAAAAPPAADAVSGFGVIDEAALRLGDRADAASDLRRTAHARHRFDFDAFIGDLLVLDLAAMRRSRFGDQALRLVQTYGLTDVEVFHYLVGGDHVALPEAWHAVPTWRPVVAPKLVHWADGVKPWHPLLTGERDRWQRYAARLGSSGLDRGDGEAS